MPNMDGVEALKELLRQDPGAKVVMVSAMGQESLVVEAVTAGAVDFVVKPFEADRVVDAINKALA
jgi:two-component system chemotaxis response regulator CheY